MSAGAQEIHSIATLNGVALASLFLARIGLPFRPRARVRLWP